MRLATLPYMEEVKRRSNADAGYLALAKGNNESYTLVLEPEPGQGVAEQLVVGFNNLDGKINEIWLGQRPTQFTLSAPMEYGSTSCAARWGRPRPSPCAS